MKRLFNWQVVFGIVLIFLSILFYFIHYLIFKDLHHIFLYLIGDIAFLFVDVLIVMLLLHHILAQREKQSILKKLNMVIGTFFSEVGTELIKRCAQLDSEFNTLAKELVIDKDWTDKELARLRKKIKVYQGNINSKNENLPRMKELLIGKRYFLLNLLENPNLLEHESFTELLWAVFHLAEELGYRKDLSKLPDADYDHLSTDIKRVYHKLNLQWLDYMIHLKQNYPYLFSLAIRTNPFDANASVEIH